ncbi:MAG: permease-like cell division protein FtsX [Patescibacteria group bacterium]|nr:permease-like cell division protein FtsX [Patescibacteria group bacterium]
MIGLTLIRSIKLGWQNFWRNRWLSLVTVIILILTLFLISLVGSLKIVADQTFDSVKEKVDFSIYFEPSAEKNEITEIKNRFEEMNEVKLVKHITPQEALKDFREEHKNNEAIIEALEALEDNPLGSVLVVRGNDLNDYEAISQIAQSNEYEDIIQTNENDFEDNKTLISRLSSITSNINHFGLILIVVFATISFLVIFNTIRITIYSYRSEIGIMKLVGASNNFVRAPFIIESILYALVSSIISVILLYSLINSLEPFLNNFFTGYNLNIVNYFNNNFLLVFGFLVLVSIFLCVVSSIVAVRRYLRV